MKRTAENIISLKNINKSFPLELGGEQQVLFDINFSRISVHDYHGLAFRAFKDVRQRQSFYKV